MNPEQMTTIGMGAVIGGCYEILAKAYAEYRAGNAETMEISDLVAGVPQEAVQWAVGTYLIGEFLQQEYINTEELPVLIMSIIYWLQVLIPDLVRSRNG